jgi:hypothetical protein
LKSFTRAAVTVPVLGLAALFSSTGVASAAEGSAQAELSPVPVGAAEGASGTAMVEVEGTTLSFTLAAQGLLDGAPHAAHIHFGADARHECPTDADNNAAPLEGETNEAEHFTTTEGAPAYGDIVVSLTLSGDTTPESGLAVDRFESAGEFEYMRADAQVTEEVGAAITSGEAIVVVHGVDYDGDGTYTADGERGPSDLDPALPGEATDPALCGVLNASQMGDMPSGGVSTGGGSTTGTENAGLIGLGAAAVVGGGVALIARRRTSTDS